MRKTSGRGKQAFLKSWLFRSTQNVLPTDEKVRERTQRRHKQDYLKDDDVWWRYSWKNYNRNNASSKFTQTLSGWRHYPETGRVETSSGKKWRRKRNSTETMVFFNGSPNTIKHTGSDDPSQRTFLIKPWEPHWHDKWAWNERTFGPEPVRSVH